MSANKSSTGQKIVGCHPGKARILVATSDAFLLSEYTKALQDAEFRVSSAFGGIECLEQLRASVPELIVLDAEILWGGADGVLAVVADDPEYRSVPAMVVSSRRSRSALYQAGRFIISDFQSKPFSGKRLVRRINFLFEPKSKLGSTGRDLATFVSSAATSPGQ